MPQPFRSASATNAHPALTSLVVNYIRKRDEFPLNRYTQFVQTDSQSFFWYELDRDQQIRVRNLALEVWADGAKREPRGDNHFPFRELQAFAIRYDFNSVLGNETIKRHQDAWKIKTIYAEGLGSQAMTARTLNVWKGIDGTGTQSAADPVWKGLDNPNTWPTSNVADVNALNNGAGTWDKASANESDVSYMAIRRSLLEAANRIFIQTRGKVKWRDLRLLISPNLAKAMSNSPEIREFYKFTMFKSDDTIEGPKNYNEEYGLPGKLYGVEVVVEDSMILQEPATAAATAASANAAFIKNDHQAVLVTRQGGIDSVAGPSYSTFQLFWNGEQLALEEFVDAKNRITEFHLTDCYTPVATATASGFLIQNVM